MGSTEVKGMRGWDLLDVIPTCVSLQKHKETVLLPSKLRGEYELLNFENNAEQERWWANGTATNSPTTGRSSSRGGDVAYVVIWEGFL